MNFMFPYIGNVIIPTVTHSIIFQRGWYTTNQIMLPAKMVIPWDFATAKVVSSLNFTMVLDAYDRGTVSN